jgi:hypothetical protein
MPDIIAETTHVTRLCPVCVMRWSAVMRVCVYGVWAAALAAFRSKTVPALVPAPVLQSIS